MARKRNTKLRRMVEAIIKGDPVLVRKKTYAALIPYLRELKEKGYRIFITHFFNEDKYLISAEGIVITFKARREDEFLKELF